MAKKLLFGTALALIVLSFAVMTTAKAVTLTGDVNGDGNVDLRDIYRIVKAFGSHGPEEGHPEGSPNWDAACDLVVDNSVDVQDMYAAAMDFGKSL